MTFMENGGSGARAGAFFGGLALVGAQLGINIMGFVRLRASNCLNGLLILFLGTAIPGCAVSGGLVFFLDT